jgi:hypothetical protein
MLMSTENEPNEAEVAAELAKPEDISNYVEEREEQEGVERIETEAEAENRKIQEKLPELRDARKASRYKRLKRARDQYKSEVEELRAKYEPEGRAPEDDGDVHPMPGDRPQPSPETTAQLENSLESARHLYGEQVFNNAYSAFVHYCEQTKDQAAYQRVMNSPDVGAELVQWHSENAHLEGPTPDFEAEMEQGRQQQEFQQQLAARDAEIRVQTEANIRAEAFAKEVPDFLEMVQALDSMVTDFPPVMTDLIRRSPHGPEIAYILAKDFFGDLPGSPGDLVDHARSLANDPIAQARMVGQMEQAIMTRRGMIPKGGIVPTPRATRAPAPLRPVRGGADGPKDIHTLAKSDDAEAYIRARRGA